MHPVLQTRHQALSLRFLCGCPNSLHGCQTSLPNDSLPTILPILVPIMWAAVLVIPTANRPAIASTPDLQRGFDPSLQLYVLVSILHLYQYFISEVLSIHYQCIDRVNPQWHPRMRALLPAIFPNAILESRMTQMML